MEVVELERAIFFKNFLVVESGKIVSTTLNPTFCPDCRAVVYKSEKTLHSYLGGPGKKKMQGTN